MILYVYCILYIYIKKRVRSTIGKPVNSNKNVCGEREKEKKMSFYIFSNMSKTVEFTRSSSRTVVLKTFHIFYKPYYNNINISVAPEIVY